MNTKYAVYNMEDGTNTLYDTKEMAVDAFWKNVVSLARSHAHNTAYMVVEQYEDGSEKWYNDNNQEIDRPQSLEERLNRMQLNNITDENKTTVEVLP